MIGGLSPDAISKLRGRQDYGVGQAAPVTTGLAGQPTPVQSGLPAQAAAPAQQNAQLGGPMAMIIARLLQQKQMQMQQQQPQAQQAPPNWRDQPIYSDRPGMGTYNSVLAKGGGDWRNLPTYMHVDNKNPGGKFTLADPLGGLIHAVGGRGIGPAEWGNRGFFGLGLGNK